MKLFVYGLIVFAPLAAVAQEASPVQSPNQQNSPGGPNPIFKVEVVSKSVSAVSYRHRSGWTKVDFQGTSLAPKAKGTAEVNGRLGAAQIKVDVKNLPAAQNFGPTYLTFVLWAITPDGHPANIGELVVDKDGNFKTENFSTRLQEFGLIVTAEPYYNVAMPSDVVVMENIVRKDTLGKEEMVDAKYQLLPRGQYTYHVPEGKLQPITLDSAKKNPLEIYEAQNAVQIARYAKADQFAEDSFKGALTALNQAEDYQARKQWKPAIMTAREAVQKAEDSRVISLRRQQQIALDTERKEAAEREAAAKQRADQEAAAAAESARQQQLAQQREHEEAAQRALAEKARAEADAARLQADAARAEAAEQAQKAQLAAAEADRLRAQAENDKNALREQLLQQFNAVLQTRETTRGLVINMSDVLFDTSKYSLKDTAREKLARLSGIVASHPGLNLQVEGYTDSTGSDGFNQKLSEQRATTVREYLMNQGLSGQTITSVGYGKQYPVASNDTSSGRAMNRRVEMVVSGEIIGVKIGTPPSQGEQPIAPAGPIQPTGSVTTQPAVPQR